MGECASPAADIIALSIPELVELVIGFVHGREPPAGFLQHRDHPLRDLKSCALVARVWREPAQRSLFETYDATRRQTETRQANKWSFLARNPRLAGYHKRFRSECESPFARAAVRNMPNLVAFDVRTANMTSADQSEVLGCLHSTSRLRELRLDLTHALEKGGDTTELRLPRLEHLVLEGMGGSSLITAFPRRLVALTAIECSSDFMTLAVKRCAGSLRWLHCDRSPQLSSDCAWIVPLLPTFPKLHTLSLTIGNDESPTDVLALLAALPASLEVLSLTLTVPQLEALTNFLSGMPRARLSSLRELYISGLTWIRWDWQRQAERLRGVVEGLGIGLWDNFADEYELGTFPMPSLE